jgi:hypothetical protein
MRNQKMLKAVLAAGIMLFVMISIAAAYETVTSLSKLNKGTASVMELKTLLMSCKFLRVCYNYVVILLFRR